MKANQMNVLITGACGGIGQALAIKLAESGASLYLTGRDKSALGKLHQQLLAIAGPEQIICSEAVDLTDDAQLDQMINRLGQLDRPINVLVNNAGIISFDLFENVSAEDIEKVMYLNSVVTMKLTHRLLPGFKKLPAARVVNVASTFGAIGFPGYSIYSASKFAVRGFSEALGRELSDSNVSVGCFLPRATRTKINSSKVVELNEKLKVSMDSPEVVAQALAKFLGSSKKLQAIGWPEKLLVRLNSMFPALIGSAIEKQLPTIKQYAV